MKTLYIFDFDGTLVDSLYDSIHCVNQALEQEGKPVYRGNLETIIYKDFRKFLVDNDAGKNSKVYHLYNDIYRKYDKPNTKPYEGIIDVLKTLSKQGATLAVCSNKENNYLVEYTKKLFPNIDFKYISGHREGIRDKPNPDRLLEIIEKEGTPLDEVIYYGDKDVDIEAAKQAGIDMILVSYGQGNEEDYNNDYPLKIIDSPRDLLDF